MAKFVHFLFVLPILVFLLLVPALYYVWRRDSKGLSRETKNGRKFLINSTQKYQIDAFDPKTWKNYVESGLDLKQDACSSFYKFVCNNWVENNFPDLNLNDEAKLHVFRDYSKNFSFLPYSSEFHKTLNLFNNGLLQSIRILDKCSDSNLTFYEKSVRNFYNQCIRFDERKVGNKVWALYRILEKVSTKKLPFFQNNETLISNNPVQNIWKLAAEYHARFRTDFLFRISMIRLNKECKKRTMLLIAPFADWYEPKFDKNLLIQRLNDIAQYQNVSNFEENNQTMTKIEKIVEEMGRFRREMKKLFDLHGKTERKVRLNDLERIVKNVPWEIYFKELLPEELYDTWKRSDPEVILKGENYFRHIDSVLARFDFQVLLNFASNQLLKTYLKSAKYRLEPRKPGEVFETVQEKCLDLTLKYFSPAALRIYLERFLGLQNKVSEWRSDIESLMQSILSSLRYSLAGLDWMDRRDRALLIKKVNNINFYPGIPDWLTDDEILRIRTPQIDEGPNVDIYESSLRMERDSFLKEAWELVDSKKIVQDPEPNFEIDATYRQMAISLGTGFVLPPLYHIDYPVSIKYGTLGWILAHELMHAFDVAHINERPPGIGENEWLSQETLRDFQSKKHCIMKQFSKLCYRDSSFCVRGKKTVNDNMADVEGLKIAYLAYKISKNQNGPLSTSTMTTTSNYNLTFWSQNVSSSESNFTDTGSDDLSEKLFLLAAGRMWCGVGSEMTLRYFWDDVHTPRMARVDVAMKNFATFAHSFKCPVGAPMAPIRLCSIWSADIDVS